MTSVREIIGEGHRLLAKRAIDAYNNVWNLLDEDTRNDLELLKQFRDNLKEIEDKGDIRRIGKVGKDNLRALIFGLESTIHQNAKPSNGYEAVTLALNFYSAYKGISVNELIHEAGIERLVEASSSYGGLSVLSNLSETKRNFLVFFKSEMPAYSVIINSGGLYMVLQPEFKDIEEIISKMKKIDGYRKLNFMISGNDALKQKRDKFILTYHELAFLNLPEVIEMAKQDKINTQSLINYVNDNRAKVDFLYCYNVGGGEVMSETIIASYQSLHSQYEFPLMIYRLMSLASAILSPFGRSRGKICEVGVGLFEYMRNLPEGQRSALKNSSEFHRELYDAYFKQPILRVVK